MVNHPNRRLPILGTARNAFPGDTVYRMLADHVGDDGVVYASGTEYVPLRCGINNTRRGSPTVQTVQIEGRTVQFTGARNSTVRPHRSA